MCALQILPDVLPKEIVVTIDTQCAITARIALELGVEHSIKMMVNDIIVP